MKKSTNKKILTYFLLISVGVMMIYPFIWLVMGAFKSNEELFGSAKLLPASFSFDAFITGWKGNGQVNYFTFYKNTLLLVIPTVLFTLISSSSVAYGFARFNFPFKTTLFSIVIATLLLPNSVILLPRYLLFNKFGWVNTYLPFQVPALLAAYPFFIFMLVQFFRGLPRELDEAACLDGCNSFSTFTRILLPLCKPAIFSAAIFQFVWTWNDFMNPLVYISSVKKYPISLALKMSLDLSSAVEWNQIMAMSTISIIPSTILFFLAQDYFVEGIATFGLKG